jgi:hypothetical protein
LDELLYLERINNFINVLWNYMNLI